MFRKFLFLSFTVTATCLQAQYNFIVTPVPPESLSRSGISVLREYYRSAEMAKDSLMMEFKVDNKGYPYYQRFRVNHKTFQWGIREISINSDSTERRYASYGWDGKTKVLYQERIEVFKKGVGMYLVIKREFDTGIHTYDTLHTDPEMINQVIWNIYNGDTVRKIVNRRYPDHKIYSVKEKKGGVWTETESMNTTYKKDGGFDTFEHYKNGKLFNTYNWKDLEKNKIEDRNGLEHSNDNPLPSDDTEKTKTSYTDKPFSMDPVLKDASFPGAYKWVDHYEFGSSQKIYLTEVFDPRGLLVLKWHRNNDDRYYYRYEHRKFKKK